MHQFFNNLLVLLIQILLCIAEIVFHLTFVYLILTYAVNAIIVLPYNFVLSTFQQLRILAGNVTDLTLDVLSSCRNVCWNTAEIFGNGFAALYEEGIIVYSMLRRWFEDVIGQVFENPGGAYMKACCCLCDMFMTMLRGITVCVNDVAGYLQLFYQAICYGALVTFQSLMDVVQTIVHCIGLVLQVCIDIVYHIINTICAITEFICTSILDTLSLIHEDKTFREDVFKTVIVTLVLLSLIFIVLKMVRNSKRYSKVGNMGLKNLFALAARKVSTEMSSNKVHVKLLSFMANSAELTAFVVVNSCIESGDVTLRITTNNWLSYHDVRADLLRMCDKKFSVFNVRFRAEDSIQFYEFAIKYEGEDGVFWDNCSGKNYKVVINDGLQTVNHCF